MIAALPMYDWPENRRATDAFWQGVAVHLRDHGVTAPATLTRDRPTAEIWQDSQLLMAQTCGLPFVAGRCGSARVFARPDFGIEGATDGFYSSALVCRHGDGSRLADFRGSRVAINEYGSQSGCNAMADAVGETDFFSDVLVTGAHRASASAVANGDADLAAVDAVSWALFRVHEAEAAARLTMLDWTRPMPATPYITSPRHDELAPRLRDALTMASVCQPGLPISIQAACNADYAPIRQMADALKGQRLAPGAPPL